MFLESSCVSIWCIYDLILFSRQQNTRLYVLTYVASRKEPIGTIDSFSQLPLEEEMT
jgi:hypothetical protein